ncbi:pentapeptide repeat-containing protein [Calothrix sp. CCY 0018]|uniref:pentapeptide repeat-containing protein n=1 Tax=Calothrix sp. CCY 0018 TaxID=3103864 RepID=UPI0039C73CE7
MTGKVQKFLTQDIWEVFKKPTSATETGAEVGKTGLELVVALGLLGSPLAPAGVAIASLSCVGLATKGIKFYVDKTQEPPTLEECVVITSRLAYLESLERIIGTIKGEDLLNKLRDVKVSEEIQQRTDDLQLTDTEARKAITCFRETKLADDLNRHLSFYLKTAGITKHEADIITQRVAWNTQRYLNQALAEVGDAVKSLSGIFSDGYRQELEKYHSIDDYLEKHIATKPKEKVFAETFAFKDIYVPLRAKPLDKNGDENTEQQPVDLESWVKELLQNPHKKDKVIFIQGDPGRGKSVSCRMFADWVRQNLYPIWIPVLIRLRDIRTFEKQFENTLKAAVDTDFAVNDPGWLTDKNIRYLFLLDGFDELLMEGRTTGALEEFLKQVGSFQESCNRNPEKAHRVLITGRTLALQSIERNMPENLERVKILPMDGEVQQQWFRKWEAQVGTDEITAFQQFLHDDNCPERVRELAQEPLLLYLLGAMYRDRELTPQTFAGSSATQAKILIYQKSLDWVLTKQRPEWLQQKITEQETEGLRQILTEAGLCVIQSGGECAPMSMIEQRLKGDQTAKQFLEAARERIGDNPLRNALAAFYLQPGRQTGSVEFAHKSFSEFLFAERLKESLESWTELGRKGRGFLIQEEQMHWEIYDLFGYGGLTPEVVEYLMSLVTKSDEFRPIPLLQRLDDFYQRWCDGEFIDAYTETLPQKKSLQLHEQDIELGQRQVDIYTGLNAMILLLELNRYARGRDDLKEIVFYPSGVPQDARFRNQLLRVINYSNAIKLGTFNNLVKLYLSGADLRGADLNFANLSGANLSGANLSGADLSGADLRGADLRGADLNFANLSRANLSRANLSGANLSSADLSGAKLSSADLSDANLSFADLSSTDLSSADLSSADLSGANLSRAILSRAILSRANLSSADLSRAILSGANLSRAILSGANLSRADLSGANLSRAILSRADLSSAYLSSANLSGADLSGAILSGADLSGADLGNEFLRDIRWDENTNWEGVRGLETVRNVPEALKQQLGLS